jgi:hypothetical protein
LTPSGVSWGVIIPGCDGDVSDLEGLNVFERTFAAGSDGQAKMALAVWGANHNFFNTEWQTSDADPLECPVASPIFVDPTNPAGSTREQQAGLIAVTAFFRGFVGKDAKPANATVWNSDYSLPAEVEALTHFERAFVYGTGSQPASINELQDTAGLSAQGIALSRSNMREPTILGQGSGSLDVPVPVGAATQASSFSKAALELRAARQGDQSPALDVTVQLLDPSGRVLGQVPLHDYVELDGNQSGLLLATARIWLSEFGNVDVLQVATVRFTWSSTVGLLLANLRLVDASVMPLAVKAVGSSSVTVRAVQPHAVVTHALTTGDGTTVRSASAFGFRAGLHQVFQDGQPVAGALVQIEADGQSATLSGVAFDRPTEIRYGQSERWLLSQ